MYDFGDFKRDATDSDWGMLLLYGFYHIQLILVLANNRLISTFFIPNIIFLILLAIFFYKRKKEKKRMFCIAYGFAIATVIIYTLLEYMMFSTIEPL
jgi:hypothetical protein